MSIETDRPAHETHDDEMEITPAMIRAGSSVLSDLVVPDERAGFFDLSDVAGEVFRAMWLARVEETEGPRALMDEWQPIDTLPGSPDAPPNLTGEREPLILAKTADGRRMIWRPSILRAAMKPNTPAHLGFPAIAWMPLPE